MAEAVLSRAQEALSLSWSPPGGESLPCRDKELETILGFCRRHLEQDTSDSLYVCGCPGTGKTMAVTTAFAILAQEERKQVRLPPPCARSFHSTPWPTFRTPPHLFLARHRLAEHWACDATGASRVGALLPSPVQSGDLAVVSLNCMALGDPYEIFETVSPDTVLPAHLGSSFQKLNQQNRVRRQDRDSKVVLPLQGALCFMAHFRILDCRSLRRLRPFAMARVLQDH